MPIYPGAGQTWTQYYKHPQVITPSNPPPLTLVNYLSGGVPGVTVTAGSTSVSGNQLDNASIGGGGTLIYSAAQTLHGLPTSVFTQTTTANATSFGWTNSLGKQLQYQLWFSVYMLFPSLPTASTRFYTTASGSGVGTARFFVATTGTIGVANTNGTTLTTSANTIPIGQWFRVEGYTIGSTGVGVTEVKLFTHPDDLVPVETNTSALTNTGAGINSVQYGVDAGTANQGPCYIGYVAVSNIGYMGPANFPTLIPQLESFPGQQWQKNYQHRQTTYLTTPDINIGPPTVNANVFGQTDNSLVASQSISPANVSVSGQSDNSLIETLSGAVSSVSVSGQSNNSLLETITGAVSNVNVAAPAGQISTFDPGSISNIAVTAQPGSISVLTANTASNVSSASSGNISVNLSGTTGNVNTVAVPGAPSIPTVITAATPTVNVLANPGTLTVGPTIRPDWWRVYRGYATSPLW